MSDQHDEVQDSSAQVASEVDGASEPHESSESSAVPQMPEAQRGSGLRAVAVPLVTVCAALSLGSLIGVGIYSVTSSSSVDSPSASPAVNKPPVYREGTHGENGMPPQPAPRPMTPGSPMAGDAAISGFPAFSGVYFMGEVEGSEGVGSIHVYERPSDMEARIAALANTLDVPAPRELKGGGWETSADGRHLYISNSPTADWSFYSDYSFPSGCAGYSSGSGGGNSALVPPRPERGGKESKGESDEPSRPVEPGIPCPPDSPQLTPPSVEQVVDAVSLFASEMGISEDADWLFSPPWDGGDSMFVQIYEVLPNAVRTGKRWNIEVDNSGDIRSASGHLSVPVEKTTDVQYISAQEALDRANTQPWASYVQSDWAYEEEVRMPQECFTQPLRSDWSGAADIEECFRAVRELRKARLGGDVGILSGSDSPPLAPPPAIQWDGQLPLPLPLYTSVDVVSANYTLMPVIVDYAGTEALVPAWRLSAQATDDGDVMWGMGSNSWLAPALPTSAVDFVAP